MEYHTEVERAVRSSWIEQALKDKEYMQEQVQMALATEQLTDAYTMLGRAVLAFIKQATRQDQQT